jgi:hypothetical protein
MAYSHIGYRALAFGTTLGVAIATHLFLAAPSLRPAQLRESQPRSSGDNDSHRSALSVWSAGHHPRQLPHHGPSGWQRFDFGPL